LLNQEGLVKIYDQIYKAGQVKHRTKGFLGPYGSHSNRDWFFIDNIAANLPPGSSILDASCGRGHLARSLKERGYDVSVTEISQWLIDTDLRDLNASCLTYDQLSEMEDDLFDCVCSNDVLEHLPGEDAVLRGLEHLVRLSRRYLCVSIGIKKNAHKYPTALRMERKIADLHLFVPGRKRWREILDRFIEAGEEAVHLTPSNLYIFGLARKAKSR
jgi:2-polyprenyl-3-methyl-5-hydroxy-6-metoxy-1,4-benzoquinol methylase